VFEAPALGGGAAPGGPRTLFIIHGFGEHSGRYAHFAHFLEDEVDCIYCIDLRGHGLTGGVRGHIAGFDDFAADVAAAVERLETAQLARHGSCVIHLFGHSLGGHVALRTAFLHPQLRFASITVTSPFLGYRIQVPLVKKIAAAVLSVVKGDLQLKAGIDASLLSCDGAVQRAYRTDKLVHGFMTPRFYMSCNAAIRDTLRRRSGLRAPLKMLLPSDDPLVDTNESLKFFHMLSHESKSLSIYEGFRHELANELGKEKVFDDIRAWLSAHGRLQI